MLIVGLTGGIACGKSTVSQKIKERGIPVIDADVIARKVVEPGKPAYKRIVAYFAPKVDGLVTDSGAYDRLKLGAYVFANKDELKVLNSIVHPAVRWEILRQIVINYFKFNRMVVLDVPLLFEAHMDKLCGRTVVVVCEEKQQLARLRQRNPELSLEASQDRINAQMSNHMRIRRADFVIDNSSTLEDLEEQVEGVLRQARPWFFVSWLEMFPPLALISAFGVFLIRRVHFWNTTHEKEE